MGLIYPRINLVETRVVFRTQEKLRKKKIINISMIVAGIYLLLFASVAGIRYFYTQKVISIDAQILQMSSKISSLKSVESKYRLVSKKLDILTKLLIDRAALQPLILSISNLLPGGVVLDSILFGDASNVLTVSVKASDVFTVEMLLTALDGAIDNDFSKIVVLSTKRAGDGSYALQLEFYFNETS